MVSGRATIFDTLNIDIFFFVREEKEDDPESSLSSSLLLKVCALSLDIKYRAEPKKKSKKKKTKKEKIQHDEFFLNRRKQTILFFTRGKKNR